MEGATSRPQYNMLFLMWLGVMTHNVFHMIVDLCQVLNTFSASGGIVRLVYKLTKRSKLLLNA